MKRVVIKRKRVEEDGGNYFTSTKDIPFIKSGCVVLDCVLGGGYPLGRIVNIVGDKSTGKTLLAIEACANFLQAYPNGSIWYNEAEAAFDKSYAFALGMPVSDISFVEGCFTIEDLFENLQKVVEKHPDDTPGLYILDSLDALSDRAELGRGMSEGTYGAEKAKKLSQLFRRLVQTLEKKQVCVFIISQVRDKIGVMFGKRTTRSGGRALDFYATQVLFLAQIKTLKKKIRGIERPVGVIVKAKCEKNKIGLPFRECEFPIEFGYGIDDLTANLTWLKQANWLADAGYPKQIGPFITKTKQLPVNQFRREVKKSERLVREAWKCVEQGFLPVRKKY